VTDPRPDTGPERVSAAEPPRETGEIDETDGTGGDAPASMSIVPLAKIYTDDKGPDPSRRSDVDEWGRSEHMRSVVRRLYDPMYRYWFRVEWDGLEKIPHHGGALLIANHGGAIPSDAPAIMHGIEEEIGRPVYGMADY